MLSLNEHIRVVFIETSDGPRVLFYGTLNTDYSGFRYIFLALASGVVTEVCLNDIPFFLIQKNLTVKMFAQDRYNISIAAVNNDSNSHVIHWIMNREDWKYCYDYLEGFESENIPCHQYLAFDVSAVVPVISKGEYSDDLFGVF